MSTLVPFDLGLHSKEIDYFASLKPNSLISDFELFDLNPFNPPLITIGSDIEGLSDMTSYVPVDALIVNNSTQDRTIIFNGHFKIANAVIENRIVEGVSTIVNYSGNFKIVIDNGVSPIDVYSIGELPYDISNYLIFDINAEVILPALGNIKFYFYDLSDLSYTVLSYQGHWIFDNETELKIEDKSVFAPSSTKAFLIYEAFAKISESITDQKDSFRSDFFGRTNSQPSSYISNGCGAWTAITNGLNLRKMLDKEDNLYPITTTFNKLFSSANAVWNLGMRIEMDHTGKEYIRVEPKEYFYNQDAIITLNNASDLTKKPAVDNIYNAFNIGYEKWNLNISKTNGIDEFNSNRNYSVPIRNSDKPLEVKCGYIGSGYIIEQTRRLQYSTLPTNDFETDNNLFFICTNINEVVSDKYSNPPISTLYSPGTISERNENFTNINNLISPETVYNLRISVGRMALNWFNVVSGSIWKYPDKDISFITGEGNYQEVDTMVNGCMGTEDIAQNQNLNKSQVGNQAPLFLPELLEFSYPLSYSDFIKILNNSERSIQVSCGNRPYRGYIKTMKYGPTTEGGIAEFQLLRTDCIPGEFDDSFGDSFNNKDC